MRHHVLGAGKNVWNTLNWFSFWAGRYPREKQFISHFVGLCNKSKQLHEHITHSPAHSRKGSEQEMCLKEGVLANGRWHTTLVFSQKPLGTVFHTYKPRPFTSILYLNHLIAGRCQASHLTSLNLSSFIYKMRSIISSSWGWYRRDMPLKELGQRRCLSCAECSLCCCTQGCGAGTQGCAHEWAARCVLQHYAWQSILR